MERVETITADAACEPPRAVAQREDRDGAPFVPDRLIQDFRALSLWLVLVSLLISVALVFFVRPSISAAGAGLAAQMLAASLLVSSLCWTRPRLSRLADGLGTVGLVWLAGLAGGVTSLMGLRLGLPLADRALLQLDRAIGIDTPATVAWIAGQPQWHGPITMSYNLTVPVLGLSILAQSLLGQRVEAWRAAFCFIGSLFTVCLVSVFTPAKGLGLWLGENLLAQLPNGAARYFWPSFDQFYSATDPVLSLASIDGVVSFPSFHTVMGLITVTLWRKSPVGMGLAGAWFVLMMAGTLPLGGHYAVDLLGGALIWAAWFWASRRVQKAA